MNLWNRLSPQARQIIAVVAGLAAAYVVVQGRRAPAPAEGDTSSTPLPATTDMPASDAGDLSVWFTGITDMLAGITTRLTKLETTDATVPVATPRPVGGEAPKHADGSQDPKLGKRRTTVQKVPKGTPETIGDVSRRVYTTANNWKYIVFFNASWLPAGANPNTVLPLGHTVAY